MSEFVSSLNDTAKRDADSKPGYRQPYAAVESKIDAL
jgi:hypothetical protein